MDNKLLQELEEQINQIEVLWNDNFEDVKTFLSLKEQDDLYSLTTRLSRVANEHEEYIQRMKTYFNINEEKMAIKHKRLDELFASKVKELDASEEELAQKLLAAKNTNDIKQFFTQISNLNSSKEFWTSHYNDFKTGYFVFMNHEFNFNSCASDIQLSHSINQFALSLKEIRDTIQKLQEVYQDHKSLIEESLSVL